VITRTHSPSWTDVDTQSVSIARYETGLSTYETRWGTFTDPWEDQPQPRCGFVVVGTDGTISSYDYEETIRLQNAHHPAGKAVDVDSLEAPLQNPIQYTIHCLEHDEPIEFGPLTPALRRRAQRIVDAARRSAERGEPVELVE
jgi:glucose-fructose oxidoreductase